MRNAETPKSLRARGLVALLAGLLVTQCGVEVGNPHPKSPGSGGAAGALTLALADAPVDDAAHVYLDVIGLLAVPLNADGSQGEPVAVALDNSGRIDALALRDGKSLDLSQARALPPGQYAGVILQLNGAAPGSVVGGDGREDPLNFAEAAGKMFVEQGFAVVAGQELQVTLHVDLRRSISASDDGAGGRRFDFGPVAHMIRKGDEGQITGSEAPAAAVSVCAYLRRSADFDAGQFGRLPGAALRSEPGKDDPNGRARLTEGPRPVRLPPTFAPDAGEIAADADAGCANAFATASVTGGEYLLAHLWPGDYTLRFFDAKGAPLGDAPINPVRLGAGGRAETR